MKTRVVAGRKKSLVLLMIGIFVVILLQNVSAHTPLPGEHNNDSLESALVVSNPFKSQVIYTALHEAGEAHYYKVDLEKNSKLTTSLFIPLSEKDTFLPSLLIMGPGVPDTGTAPWYVTVPKGSSVMVIRGKMPKKASYEPFTPASSYFLVDTEMTVTETGSYYIVVFDNSSGGRYSLAIGYIEEFTISEWLLIPMNLLLIHLWEGQNIVVLFAPVVFTVVLGIALLYWKKKNRFQTLPPWIGIPAGLLFVGSGVLTLSQMVYALFSAPDTRALVTLMFALIPLFLGGVIVRVHLKNGEKLTPSNRIVLGICAGLGLLFWAGFLIGPVFCLIAACLPVARLRKKN